MSGPRFRPIPQTDPLRPPGALALAGGRLWFDRLAIHARGQPPSLVAAAEAPAEAVAALTAPRPALCGLTLDRPRIMAVLNVTPDSFSDGGRHLRRADALAQAEALIAAGADILDVGGESTRPGAEPTPAAEERARVIPVIEALRAAGTTIPISIDTRNAAVAAAAFAAGADLLNDVSALRHDPEMAALAAASGRPVILMHARGEPRTMQDAPAYDDVLLDVVETLEERVAAAEAAGVDRTRLLIDPGIGFGKTVAHNLALTRGLAILHGLGCPVVYGASRKRFIGTVAGVAEPADRGPGSLAAALEALRQGAQVIRVHDAAETRQAFALWAALNAPDPSRGDQA
jgi:dihydropteroate synthase